jgi:hypothetical protein
VPKVLTHCSDFIETRGIVDGIYRLSGGHQFSSALHSWAPYLFTPLLSHHIPEHHISHLFFVRLSSKLGTTLLYPVFYPPLLIVISSSSFSPRFFLSAGHHISTSSFYPPLLIVGHHISSSPFSPRFLLSAGHHFSSSSFYPLSSPAGPHISEPFLFSPIHSWVPHHFILILFFLFTT